MINKPSSLFSPPPAVPPKYEFEVHKTYSAYGSKLDNVNLFHFYIRVPAESSKVLIYF